MDLNKKEQISSIFLLLFSLFICFYSYTYSIGSLRKPEEGFFPFFAGVILGLLALINLTKAISPRKTTQERIEPLETGVNWKNIIVALVVLFSYPLLLDILGFLPVTFLFVVCFLRFIEPQRWSVVFSMAGMAAAIFYLIFQYWLKIQFPPGILRI